MRNVPSTRLIVATLMLGALTLAPCTGSLRAQTPASSTQSLLEKAHDLELRGRTDMAAQTWQQVLLVDPNNIEAPPVPPSTPTPPPLPLPPFPPAPPCPATPASAKPLAINPAPTPHKLPAQS